MFEISDLEFLSHNCSVSSSYTGEILKCLGAPPPIAFQIRHIAIENLRIILRVYVVYIACDLTQTQKYYLGNIPRGNSLPFDALNRQN